jgi:uncharacterized protein (TIGR01777 family)
MRAMVTGGTGMLGQHLLARLSEPAVLTRHPETTRRHLSPKVRAFGWEPEKGLPPAEAFEGVDAVFNLAGEPVAEGRWTDAKKQRIHDSRAVGTRHLVQALGRLERKPKVLVSASAVGFYGNRHDDVLDETASKGSDFLADVCADWERAALVAREAGIRVVCVRIGIVLSPSGGALARMLPPFKLGAGGRLGNGRQWMPWIHVDDVVGLLLHAARTESIQGALNAVAPNPVTNADFTKTLGRVLRRPTVFPVPETALKIAFGEMSEILLGSQRVIPQVALNSGYAFEHSRLEPALLQVLGKSAHHIRSPSSGADTSVEAARGSVK